MPSAAARNIGFDFCRTTICNAHICQELQRSMGALQEHFGHLPDNCIYFKKDVEAGIGLFGSLQPPIVALSVSVSSCRDRSQSAGDLVALPLSFAESNAF